MKKTALFLTILLLISAVFLFTGCSGETIVPGAAWAKTETLTYDIIDKGQKIGTLVIESEKLDAGEHYLTKVRPEAFKITSAVTRGLRYKQTARDLNGNIIMESESLMNGFSSIASYKRMDFNGKKYEAKAYIDGKYYKYSIDNGEWKKIKAKAGFVDNELLYASMRCYSEIDKGYSKTVKVIDPLSSSAEEITITAADASVREEFTVRYPDPSGGEKTEKVQCISVTYRKNATPIGTPIKVLYTNQDFKIYGRAELVGNYSYHIPVKITENNLTYELISVTAE